MNEKQRNYDEKRDFIRMSLNSEAVLHLRGQSHPAVCVDLSSSGMQLSSTCPAIVGDRVEVEIGSLHSSLDGLKAIASVIRCEPATGRKQLLGLKILEML